MSNYIPMRGITIQKHQREDNSKRCEQSEVRPTARSQPSPSPFALSSFLCACSLRRFWLLSFTISCGEDKKFQKAEKSRRFRSWSRPSGWSELSEGRAQASAGFRFFSLILMALACATAPLIKKGDLSNIGPGTTNPNGATLQLAHVDNFSQDGISTCSSGKISGSEA